MAPLLLEPIGWVRSPFGERDEAPRQGLVQPEVTGEIELTKGKGFEDALSDLEGFSHLWVLFWFHLNSGWRPKVCPPRSQIKRGLFATRSPYRPNPIGMSLVKLVRIEGLTLHISGLDMLDGTPVLDLKPYVAYADAPALSPEPEQSAGWLAHSPQVDEFRRYAVTFLPRAEHQLRFLESDGILLRQALEQKLSLGPTPHAYRRIRPDGAYSVIACKDWRVRFLSAGREIQVVSIATGYRQTQLSGAHSPLIHQRFAGKFGYPGHV